MHQGHISSVRAKGLNNYVNVLGQKTFHSLVYVNDGNLQWATTYVSTKILCTCTVFKYKPLISDGEPCMQPMTVTDGTSG